VSRVTCERFLADMQARKRILAMRHPASNYDLSVAEDLRFFNDLQLSRLEYGDEGYRTWLVAKFRVDKDCEVIFVRFFDIEDQAIIHRRSLAWVP
jgi:hypothetical protein